MAGQEIERNPLEFTLAASRDPTLPPVATFDPTWPLIGPKYVLEATCNSGDVPRCIELPAAPLAFNTFFVQNRALALVWRPCVLQTKCLLDWIGPGRPQIQKSGVL